MFFIICILKIIIDYIRNNIILKYSINFDEEITHSTFNKIISLPLIYHHSRPVGDIVSRMNDSSSIKEFINNISFSFMIDFIYILMISVILFIINKIMFLIIIIMVMINTLFYIIYRKNIESLSYQTKESSSISNTYLVESLLGIDTIKNLNIEEERKNNFKSKYKQFLNINLKFNKVIINYELLQDLISNLSSVIIIYIGIIFLKNNSLSLSNLISINSLVVTYFVSFKNIISLDQLIIEAKNSSKRLLELNKENNNVTCCNIKSINKIEFNNLKFSYDGIHEILNNINFVINKNDFVFIKGNSGKGKSTIFKLLTKVLECEKGMIKINNVDINDLSDKDIINNICFVSQNEYIFTDTILNNIKLFKDIKKKDINKVIKMTNIDKILEKRNITLDFLLEENGHNLSKGERQRILIARSLLQGKKIIVLDETMNELDIESERQILNNIKTEYNLTLILISHRYNNSDLFNKVIEV